MCEKKCPFLNYYFQTCLQIICSLRISVISCHWKGWVLVWERLGGKEPGGAGTAQPCEENYKNINILSPPTAEFYPDPQFPIGKKLRNFAFQGQTLCSFNQKLSLWIPDILDPSSFRQTEIPRVLGHNLFLVISDTWAFLVFLGIPGYSWAFPGIPEHSQIFSFPSDPTANEGAMAHYALGAWRSSRPRGESGRKSCTKPRICTAIC